MGRRIQDKSAKSGKSGTCDRLKLRKDTLKAKSLSTAGAASHFHQQLQALRF
jgi:hypothetical protein